MKMAPFTSYSFTGFGGLAGVFMNPARSTEFADNSLHVHLHQPFREGVILRKSVNIAPSAREIWLFRIPSGGLLDR